MGRVHDAWVEGEGAGKQSSPINTTSVKFGFQNNSPPEMYIVLCYAEYSCAASGFVDDRSLSRYELVLRERRTFSLSGTAAASERNFCDMLAALDYKR